jgi:nucleoside-triphosphatase THEP1
MPSNIFITGVPKSGKTTLLTKLAADLSNMGMTVEALFRLMNDTAEHELHFMLKISVQEKRQF